MSGNNAHSRASAQLTSDTWRRAATAAGQHAALTAERRHQLSAEQSVLDAPARRSAAARNIIRSRQAAGGVMELVISPHARFVVYTARQSNCRARCSDESPGQSCRA